MFFYINLEKRQILHRFVENINSFNGHNRTQHNPRINKQTQRSYRAHSKKLNEIDELDFSFKPNPEKWSKKEILGHLIDSATNNHQRFIRAQFENCPKIWYDQNNWVQKNSYHNIGKKTLIDFWTIYNRHLIHILINIQPEKLGNICEMKDGTKLTVEFLVGDYLTHLEHHLHQIIVDL